MQQRVNFYYLNSNNDWVERVKEYSKVKNYTVEAEFRTEGFSGENTYQRGFALVLPGNTRVEISGSLVRYFKNGVKTGEASHGNIHDGKYHKVKAVCKEEYIQIFLDDGIIAAYENAAAERENSLVAYELYVDGTLKTEVVAFKSIKITDNTELAVRRVEKLVKFYGLTEKILNNNQHFGGYSQGEFTPETVSGKSALTYTKAGNNGIMRFRANRSLSADRAVHLEVFLKKGTLARTQENTLFTLKFNFNTADKTYTELYVQKNQIYMVCNGYTLKPAYGNGYYSPNYWISEDYSLENHWISIDIINIEKRLIVVFDGLVIPYTIDKEIADTANTEDQFIINDMNNKTDYLSFASIRYERVDGLKTAIDAIDSIGTVEPGAESAARIDTAYSAYEDLGKAERKNVVNSATLTAAVSSYKSLTGGADVNFNGSTDLLDLIALKKVTAGTKDKNFMCDLNGDGSVTSQDLAALRKLLIIGA